MELGGWSPVGRTAPIAIFPLSDDRAQLLAQLTMYDQCVKKFGEERGIPVLVTMLEHADIQVETLTRWMPHAKYTLPGASLHSANVRKRGVLSPVSPTDRSKWRLPSTTVFER